MPIINSVFLFKNLLNSYFTTYKYYMADIVIP